MARADGLGYPESPAPKVSRIPDSRSLPGEAASRIRLLEATDQMLDAWPGRRASTSDNDCALVVGTGGFLYASNAELHWRDLAASAGGPAPIESFRVRAPGWGAALVATHLEMSGPILTVTTGCSSSANALLLAAEMIQRGRVRRAIVIGAEGLGAVTLAGFASLLLLDEDGCRPFDRDRAGLQIGEAVAALMLETDDHAVPQVTAARLPPTALLMGGANRCDFHHLTSARPDGGVMAAVMQDALDEAGLDAGQISVIKAHATGSIDSDAAEASAIRTVFGASPPPVTALKRYLGHTLGACGAVETAAMLGCIADGFIPAAAGFDKIDPTLKIEPIRTSLPAAPGACLLNFFGFGGNYTSLVIGTGSPRR